VVVVYLVFSKKGHGVSGGYHRVTIGRFVDYL